MATLSFCTSRFAILGCIIICLCLLIDMHCYHRLSHKYGYLTIDNVGKQIDENEKQSFSAVRFSVTATTEPSIAISTYSKGTKETKPSINTRKLTKAKMVDVFMATNAVSEDKKEEGFSKITDTMPKDKQVTIDETMVMTEASVFNEEVSKDSVLMDYYSSPNAVPADENTEIYSKFHETVATGEIMTESSRFTDAMSQVEQMEESNVFADTGLKDKLAAETYGINDTKSKHIKRTDYSMNTEPNGRELSQQATTESVPTQKMPGGIKPVFGFGNDILLFTAIVGNTSTNTSWDKISLQGWQAARLRNKTISACVRHRSGMIKKYDHVERHYSKFEKSLSSIATQFVFNLGGNYGKDPPEYVTLTNRTGKLACRMEIAFFLKTSFAFRHPGEIAVFAKIMFGNVSADAIISWFEIHKLFGFSKVYIYPYKLIPSAMKVLRHYEEEDKAEFIPFFKPGPEHGKPSFALGTKNSNGWNDKEVALFDGTERLRGYDYLVAFDVDEYLIPTRGKSWRELFDTVFSEHPRLAGAMFFTYLYLKDWGPASTSSPFEVARYLNRTGPTDDRQKHVVKPERLANAGLQTHHFIPLPGYKQYTYPAELIGIHHYRDCRSEWIVKNTTVQCTSQRIFDDSVYKLFKSIERNIISLKNKLGV